MRDSDANLNQIADALGEHLRRITGIEQRLNTLESQVLELIQALAKRNTNRSRVVTQRDSS